MLRVCNTNHEEVVYHGNTCPLCLAVAERDRAERDRDEAQAQRDRLEVEMEKMLQ